MEFRDFNVEILAMRGNHFDVRVASQASGELQASVSLARPIDELLAEVAGSGHRVRSAGTDRVFTPDAAPPSQDAQGADVGQALFDMLFSEPETSRALAECMTDAKASKAGVRLKLTLNTRDQGVADLARLPWELLHDESKYKHFALRPDFPIVRYLEVPKPFTVERFAPPLRVLAVAANPRQDLALNRERENLQTALSSVADVELTFVDGATIQRVADAMATASAAGRPVHVVHYMGHGDFQNGRGVLLFHKEGGGEDPVEADAFATAMQAAGDVRLVFLNACNTAQSDGSGASDPFSGVASSLVFEGIPAVVAMQRPVPDAAAIVLAKHFYACVAKGVAVDAAVSEGRRQMFFANRASLDWAIPVLFMRAPNGLLFDLGSPSPARAAEAAPAIARAADPAPATPRLADPSTTPMPFTGEATSGHASPARSKGLMLGVGGAVAAAAVAAGVYLWPSTVTPTSIVFRQFDPPAIATGETAVAHVQLTGADGRAITGETLREYAVSWSQQPEGIVTIAADTPSDSATDLSARITAAKALPAGAKVTISATLGKFKLSDGRDLGVTLSDGEKDRFRDAYRRAVSAFEGGGDAPADDASVLSTFSTLLTSSADVLPFVDEMDALNDKERAGAKGLKASVTQLQTATQAFAALKSREAGLPLSERIQAWKDYQLTIEAVRPASPTAALTRSTLAELATQQASVASVEALTLCQSAAFTGNTCARPASAYQVGDPVWFAVQWSTPPAMRGSDKIVFAFGPVDAAGRFTGTPDTRETTPESARAFVRNWRGQFTARSAGPHELRATNGKGVYVWRQRVDVQ